MFELLLIKNQQISRANTVRMVGASVPTTVDGRLCGSGPQKVKGEFAKMAVGIPRILAKSKSKPLEAAQICIGVWCVMFGLVRLISSLINGDFTEGYTMMFAGVLSIASGVAFANRIKAFPGIAIQISGCVCLLLVASADYSVFFLQSDRSSHLKAVAVVGVLAAISGALLCFVQVSNAVLEKIRQHKILKSMPHLAAPIPAGSIENRALSFACSQRFLSFLVMAGLTMIQLNIAALETSKFAFCTDGTGIAAGVTIALAALVCYRSIKSSRQLNRKRLEIVVVLAFSLAVLIVAIILNTATFNYAAYPPDPEYDYSYEMSRLQREMQRRHLFAGGAALVNCIIGGVAAAACVLGLYTILVMPRLTCRPILSRDPDGSIHVGVAITRNTTGDAAVQTAGGENGKEKEATENTEFTYVNLAVDENMVQPCLNERPVLLRNHATHDSVPLVVAG